MSEQALGLENENLLDADGRVRPGWRTAIGSMVCLIVGPSVICAMAFGVFAPLLREAFGWSVGDVGFAVTIMSINVMIVSIAGGVLVDRFGPRRTILTCIPLFGLAFAAMSQLNGQLWQLYLAFTLLPLISVGLWPGSWVKATSGWFDRRLGVAIAITTLGVGIGAAAMPLTINAIAGSMGWRAAYAILGLGSIAIAWPVAWAFVHDSPRIGQARRAARIGDIAPLFRERTLWLLMITFVGLGGFSSVLLSNLVSILEAQSVPRGTAVAAQSVMGLSTIFGRLLCGWLLDRFSVRVIGPIFAVPAAIAALVVGSSGDGPATFVCAAFVGMLVGAEIDVLGYAIKRFFGLEHYGVLYGFIFAIFGLGSATSAEMLRATHESTGGYALSLQIVAAACVVAAVSFALLPRYRFAIARRDDVARPAMA